MAAQHVVIPAVALSILPMEPHTPPVTVSVRLLASTTDSGIFLGDNR